MPGASAAIVTSLPHVPGIDCAGRVAESTSPEFCPSDPVLVTGYELGAPRWGGFAEYVRVPAEWVVRLPPDWTPEDAMTLRHGRVHRGAVRAGDSASRHPARRPARSSSPARPAAWGRSPWRCWRSWATRWRRSRASRSSTTCCASSGRSGFSPARRSTTDSTSRCSSRAGRRRSTRSAATCWARCCAARSTAAASRRAGWSAGTDVPTTVYPFLLRGVTLCGIDSAKCPREPRLEIWHKLAHGVEARQSGAAAARDHAERSRPRRSPRCSPARPWAARSCGRCD